MTRRQSTLIGGTAVLMWSALALLTTLAGPVPPFLLVALCFTIASLATMAKWLVFREPVGRYLRQPLKVWAIGIWGLFGYHFFYFLALASAPPAEAGLIAYLAPLLIVLFSALLPGEHLRWWHLAGAALGLMGVAVLVGGGGIGFKSQYWLGYAAAAVCAVVWSSYSVMSRSIAHVPTDTVGGYCAATAVLAALCHLLFEPTIWPQGSAWLAVVALGLGPVGAAFFTWDHGCKHGDIKAVGALMFAAPLLSTLLLILFGRAEASWQVAVAALLIVGGAALAAADTLGFSPAANPWAPARSRQS
jgi:drug/metabolite transporter (DMT)-like permease